MKVNRLTEANNPVEDFLFNEFLLSIEHYAYDPNLVDTFAFDALVDISENVDGAFENLAAKYGNIEDSADEISVKLEQDQGDKYFKALCKAILDNVSSNSDLTRQFTYELVNYYMSNDHLRNKAKEWYEDR